TTCDDSEILENQENLFYGNSFDIFFNWINKYCENYHFEIEFNIYAELNNRNLVKNVFETIGKLSKCYQKGHRIVVNWYYNYGDFEMKNSIINFKNIIKLPLNIIECQAKTFFTANV
ncbi:MAG: SiaC family regulatory phosphoprotein, partial [Bacteroidota bacterium]